MNVGAVVLGCVFAMVLYVQKRDINGTGGAQGGKCTRDTKEQDGKRVSKR